MKSGCYFLQTWHYLHFFIPKEKERKSWLCIGEGSISRPFSEWVKCRHENDTAEDSVAMVRTRRRDRLVRNFCLVELLWQVENMFQIV
jgi:hypothetical protein